MFQLMSHRYWLYKTQSRILPIRSKFVNRKQQQRQNSRLRLPAEMEIAIESETRAMAFRLSWRHATWLHRAQQVGGRPSATPRDGLVVGIA